MNFSKYRLFLASIYLICFAHILNAQVEPELFIDIGEHNASSGLFVNTGLYSSYTFGRNKIGAGTLFDIKPDAEKNFKASFADISHEFKIKELNFDANAFFMYNSFSNIVLEYNWGLALGLNYENFKFKLGTFSKIYSITSYAITEFEIDDHYNFSENFGIVYYIGYQLKPDENAFNISAAITNLDYFLVTQTTNPMLNVRYKQNLSTDLMWFAEAWLKTSGSFNLSINYFGFLARTGLKWKIG